MAQWAEGDSEWWDELPGKLGFLRDEFEEYARVAGLGPPETWDHFLVQIFDDGFVQATFTDSDGVEHTMSQDIGDDWETADWVWDFWDYLDDWFDGVDKDSEYVEA